MYSQGAMAREGLARSLRASYTSRRSGLGFAAGSLIIVLSAAALCGCDSGSPKLMPTWIARAEAYTPEEGSSNAFDSYALIARSVEESIPEPLLTRVFFDPDHENEAIAKLEKPLGLLVTATKKKCDFRCSTA